VCLPVHDLRALGPCARRPHWLAAHVLRRGTGRAAEILVPSDFTRRELLAYMPKAVNVTVVPSGVDLHAFDRGPGRRLPSAPYFLHVGHLERRKNLLLLLDAFATCSERLMDAGLPRTELWFAGKDAGMRAELARAAAARNVAESVRFLDVVAEDGLAELYARALAVCLPSSYEGFGLTALEGLAAGRPVLVSDRSALPEVVGDVGIVLPADDAEAWASALTTVASVGMADGGFERREHARRHSWDQSAAVVLAAWRRIVHPARVRRAAQNGARR
jgi:glycosyltransferase involved in cell wall biosynthesis